MLLCMKSLVNKIFLSYTSFMSLFDVCCWKTKHLKCCEKRVICILHLQTIENIWDFKGDVKNKLLFTLQNEKIKLRRRGNPDNRLFTKLTKKILVKPILSSMMNTDTSQNLFMITLLITKDTVTKKKRYNHHLQEFFLAKIYLLEG